MDRRLFLKQSMGVSTGTWALMTDHLPSISDKLYDKSGDGRTQPIGVHYYPWFNMHAGHEDWLERTPSEPILGEYDSDDPDVIKQHFDWCLENGIDWLSISWWGPNSVEDEVIQTALFEAERFEELYFSMLYETQGRLEEFDYNLNNEDAFDRFVNDFEHFSTYYFDRPNYLRLDDRPVVFIYVAQMLRGDIERAIEAIEDSINERPYFLVDIPFGISADSYAITRVADGITTYNTYIAREDIAEVFHNRLTHFSNILHASSNHVDRDYFPVAIPGYDDTHVRGGHPVLEVNPSRFEQVCQEIDPHLDHARGVLITSFNEWYENTQIEPYKGVDEDYLHLTKKYLATGSTDAFVFDGDTIEFSFNQTFVPREVEDESTDDRYLALAIRRLELLSLGEVVHEFNIGSFTDEPLLLQGAYELAGTDETQRWFGGTNNRAVIGFEEPLKGVTEGRVYCEPMVSNEISAEISFNGEVTDKVHFGERHWDFDPVAFSLSHPVITDFIVETTKHAETLRFNLQTVDDKEVSRLELSTDIDEKTSEPNTSGVDLSGELRAEPGAFSPVTVYVETVDGDVDKRTEEAYVREYTVVESTEIDAGVWYLPFFNRLHRWEECADRSQPAIGRYAHGDRLAVHRHIDQMQGHGIGPLIYELSTPDDFESFLPRLAEDIPTSIPIEVSWDLPNSLRRRGERSFREHLDATADAIREHFLDQPFNNRIDDRPSISIWGAGYFSWAGDEEAKTYHDWAVDEFGSLREFAGYKRNQLSVGETDPYIIGVFNDLGAIYLDGNASDDDLEYLSGYDAAMSWMGPLRSGETVSVEERLAFIERNFEGYAKLHEDLGVDFVPCVFPGFDDRHNNCWGDDRLTPRGIDPYERTFELALEHATIDRVSIGTWNDWPEGTVIEPGTLGEDEFGTAYLESTLNSISTPPDDIDSTPTPTPMPHPSPTPGSTPILRQSPTPSDSPTTTDPDTGDPTPGFSLVGTVASLASAGYLLNRLLQSDATEE